MGERNGIADAWEVIKKQCSECKENIMLRNMHYWGGAWTCVPCDAKIRRGVEKALHEDGIIEDPDTDGGLLG